LIRSNAYVWVYLEGTKLGKAFFLTNGTIFENL